MRYVLILLFVCSGVFGQTYEVQQPCPTGSGQTVLVDNSFSSSSSTVRVGGRNCNTAAIDSFCTEYDTVLAHMTFKPTPADKVIQNRMLKQLVDSGYYAKAELIDIFATHNAATSYINWRRPGTHDPIPTNSPTWGQYEGYTGNPTGTKYVKLNFIPKTDSTVMSRLSMSTVLGIGTDVSDATGRDFGVYDGTQTLAMYSRWSDFWNYLINCSIPPTDVANANSIGHYVVSRPDATHAQRNKNTVYAAGINNVTASLVTKQMYACGYNNNGTAAPNKKNLRYIMQFSYLTQSQQNDIIRIMEEYLDSYGKGLMSKTAFIYSNTNLITPLTTYLDPTNNETIHPSVINTSNTINGYKYWMANTPYPTLLGGTTSDYENPSIWASNDGVTWSVPAGLTNPIEAKPAVGFNADNEIYYDGDSLYCVWMQNSKLKYKASANGVNWSSRFGITVLVPDSVISPSIIEIGDSVYMYYVNINSRNIERQSSKTVRGTFANRTIIGLSAYVATKWHMGITKIGNTYWMPFVASSNSNIYLAYSSDGVNFTLTLSSPLFTAASVGASSLYRPTIMTLADGTVMMYYGHLSASGWQTHRVKLGLIE